MAKILIYFFIGVFMNGEIMMFDFNSSDTSGVWRTINDDVMGGISQSTFKLSSEGTAVFSGTLSPENNGGFASVRAAITESNLKDFDGAIIRIKGDGNTYALTFRTNQNFDGISYQAKFKSEAEKWMEIKVPFTEFIPQFRGRRVPDQPLLESHNIGQAGIIISDKQFGNFNIEMSWIKFYKDQR